ncbi:MAG: stage III sporulation protein AF [Clostridiales bacterium]|nr:stage III sporulation protein AF [Clostridiales bacterium]
MMEALRTWVINVCTTVFFITAVEMILPDNNLKKYCRFVLGLILMTVIINPLVKFLNQGSDITTFIDKTYTSIEEQYLHDNSNLREQNIKNTLDVFKMNLEKTCEDKLKERYPNTVSDVKADVEYDSESGQYVIKSISVGINNGSIKKIEKIDISTSTNSVKESLDYGEGGMEVRSYLSSLLDLPEDKITVYRLDKE